jgi:hypothetical protein
MNEILTLYEMMNEIRDDVRNQNSLRAYGVGVTAGVFTMSLLGVSAA